MATGDSQTANFDSWLNQATDPNNQEDRWESIQGFYQLVNQEADGPQIAVRLLAHKIQSPQEKEALQALTVLEACMNNCGKRFHSEAAKFRFLNELIKVLTPKYFGAWAPQKVKDRVTEVLYGWTLWLKDEPKIQEAYRMLKTQGIITKDPEVPDTPIMAPPPQRTKDSVFDQEEKAKLLDRLLKSGRPEDLETANRLIKSTIKEEQEKAEKAAKRESTLKQVESSTNQLRAAMEQHADAATPLQPSDDLKALYEGCERLRPSLFRLASDTGDDDAALAQILAANDELTLAINTYKERLAPGGRRHANNNHAPSSPIKSYHLIDLSALESTQSGQPAAADSPPPPPSATSLLCDLESSFLGVAEQEEPMEHKETLEPSKSYYEELMQLNGDTAFGGRDVVLRARGCPPNSNGTSLWSQNPPSDSPPLPEESACPPHLLRDIFVPMETIKPSQLEPITLYDRGGVRVSLHFARDPLPGRPSVALVVLSTVNTSALHVDNFLFQAAVPKTMSVKLQPASGTCLPPYNPLLPPPAISQVLLLANPQTRQVRLRYKLTLTHGRQHVTESGEISSFPDWSALISR